MTTQISISRQDMLDCHSRIEPHVYRTPVMTSRQLNEYTGAELFFKCENFQRTGSFKMRGATNAVLVFRKAIAVVAWSHIPPGTLRRLSRWLRKSSVSRPGL